MYTSTWLAANVNQSVVLGRQVMGGKSQELVYDLQRNCLISSFQPPSAWKNRSERATTVDRTGQPTGCRCQV